MHINTDIVLKLFLLIATFFKKLIPKDIAVVKIDIKIIIPYIFFIPGQMLFIAYTAGISNSFILTSTFIKNKYTVINKITIIMLTKTEIYFMFFLFFISSFIETKTGINNTQL